MKNYRFMFLSGFFILFLGILVMIISYLENSFLLFFIGSFLVVAGFIGVIVIQSLNLFIKDKELEIENLKKLGLTIVKCENCLKDNVLEDQYCIHCGESLGKDNDDL